MPDFFVFIVRRGLFFLDLTYYKKNNKFKLGYREAIKKIKIKQSVVEKYDINNELIIYNFFYLLLLVVVYYMLLKFGVAAIAYLMSSDITDYFHMSRGVYDLSSEVQTPFRMNRFFVSVFFEPILEFIIINRIFFSLRRYAKMQNENKLLIYNESDLVYYYTITIFIFVNIDLLFHVQVPIVMSLVTPISLFINLAISKISYFIYMIASLHLFYLERLDGYEDDIRKKFQLNKYEKYFLFGGYKFILFVVIVGVLSSLPFYIGYSFLESDYNYIIIIMSALFLWAFFFLIYKYVLQDLCNYLGVMAMNNYNDYIR